MKNTIRLTESELKRVISESVKNILKEIGDTPGGQFQLGRLAHRNGEEKPVYGKNIGKMKSSKVNPVFKYATKRQQEHGLNGTDFNWGHLYGKLVNDYENATSREEKLKIVGMFVMRTLLQLKNRNVQKYLNGRTLDTFSNEELDYFVYQVLPKETRSNKQNSNREPEMAMAESRKRKPYLNESQYRSGYHPEITEQLINDINTCRCRMTDVFDIEDEDDMLAITTDIEFSNNNQYHVYMDCDFDGNIQDMSGYFYHEDYPNSDGLDFEPLDRENLQKLTSLLQNDIFDLMDEYFD